jgi:hypothetical protein
MSKATLIILLLVLPVIHRGGSGNFLPAETDRQSLYRELDLAGKGLAEEVYLLALKGQAKLEAEGKIGNPAVITIADLSQSSCNKRLYVIDLARRVLLFNTYVAHGRNTGGEFARYFSNAAGSLKTSLGFFVTRAEITGQSVGLSLLLEGVEKGINDNALSREIIMHGASYATEAFIRKTGRLGRSWGCPALPPDLIKPVIETIRTGTCLFIYQKDTDYLNRSALLR